MFHFFMEIINVARMVKIEINPSTNSSYIGNTYDILLLYVEKRFQYKIESNPIYEKQRHNRWNTVYFLRDEFCCCSPAEDNVHI